MSTTLDQVRADAAREREEITGRLANAVARGQAAEQRLAHRRPGEYAQVRADAAHEREELRAALEDRARVLEESRAGAGRARPGRRPARCKTR